MKSIRSALVPTFLAASLGGLLAVGCDDQDRVAAGMEVTDLVAYWGVLGRDSEGNNHIRPTVRFRVRNGNAEPVPYMRLYAVFRRESSPEDSWGTGYIHEAIARPIAAGESTDEHTIRADTSYISAAAPERMFDNDLWEDVEVEVFVRTGASQWVPRARTLALRRLGPPGVEKYLEPSDDPIYDDPRATPAGGERPGEVPASSDGVSEEASEEAPESPSR